jgi:hypothetical protein
MLVKIFANKASGQKAEGKADTMDRVNAGAHSASRPAVITAGIHANSTNARSLKGDTIADRFTVTESITPIYGRSVDELADLVRRGDISPEIRQSAERFAELFHAARFDPGLTVDLTKDRVDVNRNGSDIEPDGVERAKDKVRAAIKALGGQQTPCASAVWNIVGRNETLESWAKRRQLDPRVQYATVDIARRILIAGLERLDVHLNPRSEPKMDGPCGDGSLAALDELVPLIAGINHPMAGWLAAGLRHWRTNLNFDLERALNINDNARKTDMTRRRDAALGRLKAALRCRTTNAAVHAITVAYREYVRDRYSRDSANRHAPSSGVDAELFEIAECGGLPKPRQLDTILKRR